MKKKIKIIDILCYISIGDYDKLPEEFKYSGYYWFWCLSCLTYETRDENNEEINLYDYLARNGDLNDEVEILDEEDEFKDIETLNLEQDELVNNKDIRPIDYLFEGTINQLIKNQKNIIKRLNNLDNN